MLLFLLLFCLIGRCVSEQNTEIHSREDAYFNSRHKRYVQLAVGGENITGKECTLPNGTPGHCRAARHCQNAIPNHVQQNFINAMDYLCIMEHSSIGICCPDDEPTKAKSTVAGDLPATAIHGQSVEESGISSVNRGCGISTRAVEAMGSRAVKSKDWPWMAYVSYTGMSQHCGGVVISEMHVLTAAHCTDKYTVKELMVRLGEYDYDREDDTRTHDFNVVMKIQHELYDSSNYQNDICILKLYRKAVFNTYVWPVCLPPPNLDLENKTVFVTGWGSQWFGGPHSTVLMEVPLTVWNHDKCVDSFAERIFNETLCAGDSAGGKDACQGDSGGPLMYQMPSRQWVVVGVVSWGVRCGDPKHPGIYTKVSDYLEWIVQKVHL